MIWEKTFINCLKLFRNFRKKSYIVLYAYINRKIYIYINLEKYVSNRFEEIWIWLIKKLKNFLRNSFKIWNF